MTSGLGEREDVLIVGAGVIGLAVAYELLRRGRRVTLLDRQGAGSGAARIGGGMLTPMAEPGVGEPALAAFGLESLRRYAKFVADLEADAGRSCDYRPEGTLWVAVNPDEDTYLDRLHAAHEAAGLRSTRLSPEQLVEREAFIIHSAVSGLWVEDEHSVDPRKLAVCLERAVENRGGRVVAGHRVEEIRRRNGEWSVRGTRDAGEPFRVPCAQLVLAAGAWSTADIDSPLAGIEVRPVKGQVVRVAGPELVRHNVRTPRIYLVPRPGGELIIGATLEEAGFDETTTAGLLMDLLRFGWQVLPGIYNLTVTEISAGLRPAVPDNLPLIDSPEAGFFATVGHFRTGVLLAPATAHYLAEWMTGGEAPAALAPFAAARFQNTRPAES